MMQNILNRNLLLYITILLVLCSCVTTVTVRMEHPPLIDLQGVNSITVIPFEWNSAGEYENVASKVTSAFISGLKRGPIDFVDSYPLQSISRDNYGKYADVYIIGRVTNVSSYWQTSSREDTVYYDRSYGYVRSQGDEQYRSERIRRVFITTTVTVDIEYSYIHAASKKVLGSFNKSQSGSHTAGQFRRPGAGRWDRDYHNYPQNREWDTGIAESIVWNFSYALEQETGLWTTSEERTIKRTSGTNTGIKELRKLIRQGYYGRAFDIYHELYEQTGDIAAGFNTAVLYEVNDNFYDALSLLETMSKNINESGKRTPSFISREIIKLKEYISGLTILQAFRKNDLPIEKIISNEAPENTDIIISSTDNEVIKVTEYEYDETGNMTVQRDIVNGILERMVIYDGQNETEELYMNGKLILRAYWENGRKIREERIRH